MSTRFGTIVPFMAFQVPAHGSPRKTGTIMPVLVVLSVADSPAARICTVWLHTSTVLVLTRASKRSGGTARKAALKLPERPVAGHLRARICITT